MSITALPTPPSTSDPTNFASRADAFLAALPQFVTEANALGIAVSFGTVLAIPYTFSTTVTDADPGNGTLRLDNATQNLATTIRADLLGSDAADWTSALASFAASTNTVKGYIRLFKTADSTKYIVFSVSALASPSGYKNITVAVVASSAASPFANADALTLQFVRMPDQGATGANGTSTLDYSSAGTGAVTPPAAPGTTCVGYLGTPQNIQNNAYGLVMSDAGKEIYHTSGTAHTWTIPANASVAYPIGTKIMLANESGGGNVTIAITTDTLRWGTSTGSRTLAANGTAVLHKRSATAWRLTGEGIS